MPHAGPVLNGRVVTIDPVDPSDERAQRCLERYYAELDRRFAGGFDPGAGPASGLDELRPPDGLFLLAHTGGEAVGCGGLRLLTPDTAEIKRLWVAAEARGSGVGGRLMAELEARATAAGCRSVCLDTNRALTEALALYRRSGYLDVEPFNDNPYAHHWLSKPLTQRSTDV